MSKLDKYISNEITIIEDDIPFSNLKGICSNNLIVIDSKINTTAERTCILAEELGHYYTSAGNILDQSVTSNRKQEKIARIWAVEKLISFEDIIEGKRQGITNIAELADFLNITEGFLKEAIEIWKQKYGAFAAYKDYLIIFEPFNVVKA